MDVVVKVLVFSLSTGGVCTIGTVRYTLNTEKELLSKLKEVLEEYNKVSDLLNNLYRE